MNKTNCTLEDYFNEVQRILKFAGYEHHSLDHDTVEDDYDNCLNAEQSAQLFAEEWD